MKLINLIIGKMFEEELKEIGKVIQEDINKETEYLQKSLSYVEKAEDFLELKGKIKKLGDFSWKLKSNEILDIDFSGNNPIGLWDAKVKIEEIIDNALSDGLYVEEELPEQVSDTTVATVTYGDYLQYNNESVEDIVATQFQQILDTVKCVNLSITDGTLEFEKITPTDKNKYSEAMQWRFKVKISK